MVYFEPELEKLQYQTISDFVNFRELTFEIKEDQEDCQVFHYDETLINNKMALEFLWRPSVWQNSAYIG